MAASADPHRILGLRPDEPLTNDELIAEQYKGIRPAPGYPACPDHTAKRELFALLDALANAGMNLTESCAMTPAGGGFRFLHRPPGRQLFRHSENRPRPAGRQTRRKAQRIDQAAPCASGAGKWQFNLPGQTAISLGDLPARMAEVLAVGPRPATAPRHRGVLASCPPWPRPGQQVGDDQVQHRIGLGVQLAVLDGVGHFLLTVAASARVVAMLKVAMDQRRACPSPWLIVHAFNLAQGRPVAHCLPALSVLCFVGAMAVAGGDECSSPAACARSIASAPGGEQ